MTDWLKPVPESDTCPSCGEKGLTLAVDKTHYRELFFKDGEWSASPERHTECSEEEHAVRVFCPHCGEYFHVPETIQGVEE